MEQRHEIIEFPENSPIKVFIHKIGEVGTHWHQSIELLYLVRGSVDILLGGELFTLNEDELFLIGPNIPHSLRSDNATMIATQLRLDALPAIPANLLSSGHFMNLKEQDAETDTDGLEEVKYCIASLLRNNIEGRTQMNLLNIAACYKLVHTLIVHFFHENAERTRYQDTQIERFQNLLDYINTHFHEDMSLEALANVVALTPAHLSRSFRQYMGVTLSDYIKSIRLHRAVRYLTQTTLSIEEICQKCGFPNTHSFLDAFRAKYHELPGKWRKSHKQETRMVSDLKSENSIGYYNSDSSILYNTISDFIEKYARRSATRGHEPHKDPEKAGIVIKTAVPTTPLRHTERKFIGVSRAEELLWEPVREMLREAQKEIGFEYVKMHSVLDDSMMVYSEYGGEIHFNFMLVDQVYDFLLSIGLKPYVQLSFMPKALAKEPKKTTFFSEVITSVPKDYNKWNLLIDAFTRHLLERYGKREVESWPFAVWNEPFTSEKLFGFANEKNYYELFLNTFVTVKNIDERILVGGPSHFSTSGKGDETLFRFLNFMKKANALPDFLDVHYYDVDNSEVFLNKDNIKISTRLSSNPNSFSDFCGRIKQDLKKRGYDKLPIYLTEWNSTTSHRDLLSDTCFKSGYIVKNLLENPDAFSGIGYWLLTDLHEESLLNDKLFHGGLGMFTVNGLKKPAYHAYKLLAKLGSEKITQGDGYFVTKKENDYVIVLYNYSHFSNAYADEVGINCSYTSRYSVFPESADKTVTLSFPDLTGNYTVTTEILNRDNGSVFDDFIRMGAMEPLSPDDAAYLRDTCHPLRKRRPLPDDHTLVAHLKAFEVRLVTLSPAKE